MLESPQIASLSCEYCQEWLIDFDTGRPKERRGKPQKRRGDPPCWNCPKESPELAWRHELNRANWLNVERFLEVRATNGACLNDDERSDDYLMHLFAVIDMLLRQHDRQLDSLVFEGAYGRRTALET